MTMLAARLTKSEVIQTYSRTAPIYDLWGALTETKARERALTLAHVQNGEAVLEVAIGTGLTFQEILRANPDGYNAGIDLTLAMLERARTRAARSGATNYQITVGDACALQFPDHRFDVLINSYMFDLLPEESFIPVLREFKRVLKPGGRLVLVNMTKGEHFYQHSWETVYRVNPKWLGGCRGVLLTPALSATGVTGIHRETVSQFGFPSEIITAVV